MSLKIILIGNYKSENQYSMRVFEVLMAEGYIKSKVDVRVIRPNKIVGGISFNMPSLKKWLGYVDKFILFPIQILALRVKNKILFNNVHYHICDHSNSFYLHFLPKNKTVITCHDVLAIRAGLGFTDTYCYVSTSGKVLQKIILNALSNAKKLVAVSEFTLNQLHTIDTKPNVIKNWICIHNALAEKFKPLAETQSNKVLNNFQLLKNNAFILHVGSDLERKNRKLLIHLIYEIQNDWGGLLVFAGEQLNDELLELIKKLNISNRILQIQNPTDTEIIALYSTCHTMIFPSYSEGFGWPIIEAQACGAPVITSSKAPMMDEVGGIAALYADPDDVLSFVSQFQKLNDIEFRNEIIRLGYLNTKRFDFDKSVRQYVELIKT